MISLCLFCSFRVEKTFFLFALSDDEEPKRDAPSAPSTEHVVAQDPPMQETEPAVKLPKVTGASVNKVPVTRSTKRSRKSKDTDVSLEAHEPADSSDDLSGCTVFIFLAPSIYLYVLLLSGVDEEIHHLGH
jgi:hypothetical protein